MLRNVLAMRPQVLLGRWQKRHPLNQLHSRTLASGTKANKSHPQAQTNHLAPSSSSSNRLQFRQIKTGCSHKNGASNATKTLRPEKTTISLRSNEFEPIGCPRGQNIELDDLELHLDNHQQPLKFNLTWLRDSCYCNSCTHQYSRQRLFTAKEFRREKFSIDEARVRQTGADFATNSKAAALENEKLLEIKWADGHESSYRIEWLKQVADLYKEPKFSWDSLSSIEPRVSYNFPPDDYYAPVPAKQVNQIYWSVGVLNESLEPVDFHDLTNGFDFSKFQDPTFINANLIETMSLARLKAMTLLTKQLVTYGLAKIVNVPQSPGQVLNVARSMAYERPTGYGTVFDVLVEPSEEINLAYSAQEFDLHVDLTYRETSPGVQLLHCIQNSTIGGLSYHGEAFNAAQQLRSLHPQLFEILVKFTATFVVRDPYRDLKFRRQQL